MTSKSHHSGTRDEEEGSWQRRFGEGGWGGGRRGLEGVEFADLDSTIFIFLEL